MSMSVGETTTFKAHFPSHWPSENLRNQSMVLRAELLDAKPFRHAPVVHRELFSAPLSGAYLDQTTLTERQCQEIAADATAV